jgi:hypothetical protein
VWSYGITAWEVLTDAKLPYEGLAPAEVCIRVVRDNLRLTRPSICPPKLFDFLATCWRVQPEERPNMKQIIQFLEEFRKEIAASPLANATVDNDEDDDPQDSE